MLTRKQVVALSGLSIALVLWLSYALYSTKPFQDCLGEQEKRYEAAHERKENPPIGFLAFAINTRDDTVCGFRVAYDYRDVATALATIFIALFTYTLWRSTRRLSEEAVTASRIAGKSADAATRAADVAEKTLVVTQRAYVSVNGYRCEVVKDGETITGWNVSIMWQNAGGTPAKEFVAAALLQEAPDGKPAAFDFTDRATSPKTSVGKDIKIATPCYVSMEQAQRLKSGKTRLFLCGIAEYRDLFPDTELHHTRVCIDLEIADAALERPSVFGYSVHRRW